MLQRSGGVWTCRRHKGDFTVEKFNPIAFNLQPVEAAAEDHAHCANHPGRSAVALCAGTGNYVCALCAARLGGEVYSVQFLDSPTGRPLFPQRFPGRLRRPDRLDRLLVHGLLNGAGTLVLAGLFFIVVPVGIVFSSRAIRLRKSDPLYRRLVPRRKIAAMIIATGIWIVLGWLFWLIFLRLTLSRLF